MQYLWCIVQRRKAQWMWPTTAFSFWRSNTSRPQFQWKSCALLRLRHRTLHPYRQLVLGKSDSDIGCQWESSTHCGVCTCQLGHETHWNSGASTLWSHDKHFWHSHCLLRYLDIICFFFLMHWIPSEFRRNSVEGVWLQFVQAMLMKYPLLFFGLW